MDASGSAFRATFVNDRVHGGRDLRACIGSASRLGQPDVLGPACHSILTGPVIQLAKGPLLDAKRREYSKWAGNDNGMGPTMDMKQSRWSPYGVS